MTCCYAGCRKAPSFTVYLAFKREHGGERRVPICSEHAAFLTLNDSFVPAATFAGQDVHDCGPWSDWSEEKPADRMKAMLGPDEARCPRCDTLSSLGHKAGCDAPLDADELRERAQPGHELERELSRGGE